MSLDPIWPLQVQVQAVAESRVDAGRQAAASRQDALLDQALEETFPASDPISVFRVT